METAVSNDYTIFLLLFAVTAEDLWGGVYGVSNAGRKRGRGKGRRKKMDLNKGQVIGVGK
jgi:small subunit ribosomal protein S5